MCQSCYHKKLLRTEANIYSEIIILSKLLSKHLAWSSQSFLWVCIVLSVIFHKNTWMSVLRRSSREMILRTVCLLYLQPEYRFICSGNARLKRTRTVNRLCLIPGLYRLNLWILKEIANSYHNWGQKKCNKTRKDP